MSTNARFTDISTLTVQVPSGTAPGDPVAIGSLHGVAEAVFNSSFEAVSATTDGNGFATIRLPGVYSVFVMTVLASTDDTSSPLGGASAVALGNTIYKNASSELLSKDTSGSKFGVALGTRNSGGAYATGTQLAAGETGSVDILVGPIQL